MGCQAVLGTKKIPYMIEAIEIKLKETAVASGAPINPRAMGSGPHTVAKVSECLTSKRDALIPRR
jgi:hypothetical protein